MSYRVREVNVLIRGSQELILDNGHDRSTMLIGGRGTPRVDYDATPAYFFAGASPLGYSFKERKIALQLWEQARSRNGWYAIRDRLVNILRPNQDGDLILRHVRANNTKRDIVVVLEDDLFANEHTFGATGYIETLNFTAHDPFFYDPALQSVLIDDVNSGGFGFPFGFPFGFMPTGFVGKTITYNGNVVSYPQVQITGPFTTLTLSHVTKKASLYITSPLNANRTLFIDLSPRNISAKDDLNKSYLNAMSSSDFLNFALYSGINQFSASGVGYSGSTKITLKYYERYLSL